MKSVLSLRLLIVFVASGLACGSSSRAIAGNGAPDVNSDGCVDDLDYMELLPWAGEPAPLDHPILGKLDLNRDGQINATDMDIVLNNYQPCK